MQRLATPVIPLKEAEHDPGLFPLLHNTKKVFVDYCGAVVDDLAEARNHPTRVVESFTSERSLDEWRDWVLHVSDDRGDERRPDETLVAELLSLAHDGRYQLAPEQRRQKTLEALDLQLETLARSSSVLTI